MNVLLIRGELTHPVTPARRDAVSALFPGLELVIDPSEAAMTECAGRIEIVFGSLPQSLYNGAPQLKWVQLQGAGAEKAVSLARDRGVIVTNASGVHAEPISEHLLAMLLALARDLPLAFERKRTHSWSYGRRPAVFELRGKRAVVVGIGAIGDAFARKAAALGVEIVGVRRKPLIDGAGSDPPYLRIVGSEDLGAELPQADFLVITVPLTDETRGMIGNSRIAQMKRGSYLFNIGRGATIDQQAMIAALQSGQLAGAGLDVFDPEPLPEDSPLWDMENVVLTAHYAGITPAYSERLWRIFLDNAQRYAAGTALFNVVDPLLGY